MKNDHWIYRAVVVVFGITVLMSLIGSNVLLITDHSTPAIIVALESAAIVGLARLLTPSPTNR